MRAQEIADLKALGCGCIGCQPSLHYGPDCRCWDCSVLTNCSKGDAMIAAGQTAQLSPCGQYRYTLTRRIGGDGGGAGRALFIMLNPSTADADKDDPTIRRCKGFAHSWGCSQLTVVNLFAYRATDPAQLSNVVDPWGPDNTSHLVEQLEAHSKPPDVIVCAWGAAGIARSGDGLHAKRTIGAFSKLLKSRSGGHPRCWKRSKWWQRQGGAFLTHTGEDHKTLADLRHPDCYEWWKARQERPKAPKPQTERPREEPIGQLCLF